MTMVMMGSNDRCSVTSGHTRSHIPGTTEITSAEKAWPIRGGREEREDVFCDAVTL